MFVREMRIRFRCRRATVGAASRATSPAEAANVFARLIGSEVVEVFGLLCLSAAQDVLAYHELSRGTLDSTVVHPRDVFRAAMFANAATIVVGHNHPSGHLQASAADVALTRRLADAATLMGIPLVDHLIVGPDSGFFSFREAALI